MVFRTHSVDVFDVVVVVVVVDVVVVGGVGGGDVAVGWDLYSERK